jgi:arylsulfatase A-like enzyme
MSKPNIVFFMMDQLSAKWLEAASAGACPTPNIDALRARGVSFTNCITSNPVCCPTRATLATGLTTRQHGVLENGYQLDLELPTFMRVLQQAGWRTGALGKVHFQPHYRSQHPDYRPYGFDVTHITEDGRGGEWFDWVEKEHPEHYDDVLALIWAAAIPEFSAYGPNKVNLKERIRAVQKDYKWSTPEFPLNTRGAHTLLFPEEVSQTNWITGHGLDFIRSTPADQPICAHISYVQPHGPFHPPGEYMQYVNPERIPEPAPAEWYGDPEAPGYFRDKKPTGARDKYSRHCYFADIVHLDRQLGLVTDALATAGRGDDTYLILLADHGELLGDHGFGGKEERHYDACIRVPLIIAGPGLQQGITRDEIVQLEDICPTVLEMAGQAMPPMPKDGCQRNRPDSDFPSLPGRSLLPLCRGEQVTNWRGAAYCESYCAIWSNTPNDWARTVRTARWRYTWYPDDGEQLFDLETDPDEQRNLARDPAHAETRQSLRDQLLKLIVLQDWPRPRRELFALGVH